MDQRTLRNLLSYDQATGLFTHLIARDGVRAGKPAGSPKRGGYICIGLQQRYYLAHRLAWLYVHGEWPTGQIDHINGHRADNRIANLRDVSPAENSQNKRLAQGPGNTLLGASLHRQTGKWQAQIWAGGQPNYLGLFSTPEEAHAAYVSAKRELHSGGTL